MSLARHIGGIGLGLALLLDATGWAQEIPATRERGARGTRLLSGAGDESFYTGFVLVDGTYVPPPYVIRGEDGVLLAGGVVVAAPMGRGQRRNEKGEGELKRMLRANACFVVQRGEPVVVLAPFPAGVALLSLLVPGRDRNTAASDLVRHAAPEVHAVLWREWLLNFVPTPEFQSRATAIIAASDRQRTAQRAQETAYQRLREAEFPLLTCALLLAALAGWRLLRNVPAAPEGAARMEWNPGTARMVRRSLLLVLALAALDSVWTLLSTEAGQMRELNPLAARLLNQPGALLAFKLACTVGPAALIFALRRHRAAQLAAWWMCFITTLVACRWVVQAASL
jgi:Domain of unknown function (DUF5658)